MQRGKNEWMNYSPGYWAIFSNLAVQLFSCKRVSIQLSWVELSWVELIKIERRKGSEACRGRSKVDDYSWETIFCGHYMNCFWAPWSLSNNERYSSWAHWKARSELPINVYWTFFSRCYGRCATAILLQRGQVDQEFQVEGVAPHQSLN